MCPQQTRIVWQFRLSSLRGRLFNYFSGRSRDLYRNTKICALSGAGHLNSSSKSSSPISKKMFPIDRKSNIWPQKSGLLFSIRALEMSFIILQSRGILREASHFHHTLPLFIFTHNVFCQLCRSPSLQSLIS